MAEQGTIKQAIQNATELLNDNLPDLAEKTGELLNSPIKSWQDARTPLTGTAVEKFKHMMQRVEPERIQNMIEESKEQSGAGILPVDSNESLRKEPIET